MNVFENFEEIDGQIINNNWIEWYHFGIPNEESLHRELVRISMLIFGHCLICTKLDGCYFVERKMPQMPQHERCDCQKMSLSSWKVKHSAKAECDVRKFTEYIFSPNNSKKEIFEKWGYTVENSSQLKAEFEKQAREQYIKGNYKLKGLDYNGQRLAIPITLNNNTFYSGWIVYPDGKIKNTTPFGGWINETIWFCKTNYN